MIIFLIKSLLFFDRSSGEDPKKYEKNGRKTVGFLRVIEANNDSGAGPEKMGKINALGIAVMNEEEL